MASSVTRARRRRELFRGREYAPCYFCRKQLTHATATLEHVHPISLGGSDDISNLRLSCSPCNLERGVDDFDTFQRETRARIAKFLERAAGCGNGG